MFVLLALYYFSAPSVQGLPVPIPTSIEPREPSSCNDLHYCRTVWNIIWSCIITIFTCTWVAVHPNIPGPNEKWITVASRRMGITICAVIAPELVIMWALRQWVSARKLAKKYKRYKWTQTHGFFAVMGGFMLFKDSDDPEPRILDPKYDLEKYLARGDVIITEAEIRDRSRGDILSKGLVIVQTLWFILQCAARQVEDIPITKLELVTLAFATLNFITYGLWWNKPLGVQCPYRIIGNRKPDSEGPGEAEARANKEANKEQGQQQPGGGRAGVNEEAKSTGRRGVWCLFKGIITSIGDAIYQFMVAMVHGLLAIPHALLEVINKSTTAIKNIIQAAVKCVRDNGVGEAMLELFFGQMLAPFLDMTGLGDEIMPQRVSRFYAGLNRRDEEYVPTFVTASTIAALFGAIHCFGWKSEFPSHTEQFLWRLSSITITTLPLLPPLMYYMNTRIRVLPWLKHLLWYMVYEVLEKLLVLFVMVAVIFSPILYVLARITLLVLALTSLRSLPAEAYQTVRWTTFIPHV